MNCPRCSKDTHGGYAHTCTPTEGWRKMETEIAELKRQLEESSKGALACANRILQQEHKIGELRQQLAESKAREARLLKFIDEVAKQTPEKPDYWSSCSQCERNSSKAEDFIALPHDDTALREYRDAVIEECAVIAGNSCLVPPDGGSPTVDEAARRIRMVRTT